mmetsp:Transcript_1696/g.3860  ORF Transcript_1696/g.3860 Transcript_1696/m.3860 type:complete len:428 (-) Transcript_1696:165-1448(-)
MTKMTTRHSSSSRPRIMTMSFAWLAAILVVQLLLLLLASTVPPPVQAFIVPVQRHQQPQQTPSRSCSSSLIVLKARKVKRSGLLNDLAEAGGVVSKSTTPRSRRSSSSSAATRKKKSGPSKSSSSAPPEGIAPGLADWVSKQQQSSDELSSEDIVVDDNDDDDNIVTSTATKEVKKGKKAKRSKNNKKSEEQQLQDSILNERVDSLLDQLDSALEEKGNLAGILSVVGQLFDVTPDVSSLSSSSRLKSLLASKPGRTGGQGTRPQYNFRLAWVGSDEALCHIGTGLHKVPLARMQEVFLCCLGRNRIEVLEVISITGPFPNIRNTLQGETKIMKGGGISDGNSNMEKLRIDVDSMTDGTGKELLPPGEKSRIVDLDVYFSDERAIVAVVPPFENDADTDPLRKDGQNILVFVREDEMDDKLDSLRVS